MRKCSACKREFETNKFTMFIRYEKRPTMTWGLRKGFHDKEMTMPVANLPVCEECFFKLTEEQDLRLKGIVKCEYCHTFHKTETRCSNCGAP